MLKSKVSLLRIALWTAGVALLVCLQACGGSSSSSPSPSAAWPMFHQNLQHTGLSPFSTANDTGVQKWAFAATDAVSSSPAVGADGTIYVGSADDNLYAVNPSDGTQKWAFTTGGAAYSSPAIGKDGTIYVGSFDDNLYAVKPNGSMKWEFTTSRLLRKGFD
jgi:outer membrane protein assembly factor BamB